MSENPSKRLYLNHKGMATVIKSDDGQILPRDIDFNMDKILINNEVKN